MNRKPFAHAAIGLLLACASVAPLSASTITTLFASNNGGATGGAVYFDLTTFANPISITGLSLNTDATSLVGVTIYTTAGGFSGNVTNPGVWTAVATGTGTGSGIDNPTLMALSNSFLLDANSTYGIALVISGGSHKYTNGNGLNQLYSNADLSLSFGSASNVPFTGEINPRVWNGSIDYGAAAVPEPSTLGLLTAGGLALVAFRRRRSA